MPVIGRTLRFPLDIDIIDMPALIDYPSASVVSYLQYLLRDVSFDHQLLDYLVEHRSWIHHERVNEKRHLIWYKVGGIIMAKQALCQSCRQVSILE